MKNLKLLPTYYLIMSISTGIKYFLFNFSRKDFQNDFLEIPHISRNNSAYLL